MRAFLFAPSTRPRRSVLAAAFLISSVWSPWLNAQPSAEAQQLLADGKAAGTRREFAKARELLLRAHQLDPKNYEIAANLGRVELELQRWVDATEHLSLAIGLLGVGTDRDKELKLRSWLERARAQVVKVSLRVSPAGADVVVGQAPSRHVDSGTIEVFADPGSIKVRATLPNHKPYDTRVIGGPGEEKRLDIILEPIVTGAPPAATELATPPNSPRVDPAPRRIGPDRTRAASAPPLWPVGAGAGVALAGLTVGVVFALKANSAESEAKSLRLSGGNSQCATGTIYVERCARLRDRTRDVARDRNWETAGLITASAAGIASVIYWLWAENGEPPAAKATAQVAPGLAVISVDGHF